MVSQQQRLDLMATIRVHGLTKFFGFSRVTLQLLATALGGALLLLIGIWFYQLLDASLVVENQVVTGSHLTLINGEGETTAEGLVIRIGTGDRPIAVLAGSGDLTAQLYQTLTWDIAGLTDDLELALVWISSATPGKNWLRLITSAERSASRMNLREDPEWRGQIHQFGLLIDGTLTQPLLIRGLMLQSVAEGFLELPLTLATDWFQIAPWNPRSINFHPGATRGSLLTPVTAIALWVGLSSLLLMVCTRFSAAVFWAGVAILILAGWLVLDIRWQVQLIARHLQTYEVFGQLPPSLKVRRLPDGPFLEAMEKVRQALPKEPTRLFILTDDPDGFMAVRTRYHLLPHRSFAGLTGLPPPTALAAGDAVLVLGALKTIRYDPVGQRLLEPERELAAELVMEAPGFGTLYRVKDSQ